MEFQFNVNKYFKSPIVEITNNLTPPDFVGDRRDLWDTVNKVADVINEIGQASAHAQGLAKPITSADRLRHSDQVLYLMVDHEANNGNGAVIGMIKVGRKTLYMFDKDGQHYQVTAPCVLDFYIHENRQRSGLGRKLFEHMLERENVRPHNLAMDKPSDMFLNFLKKHYSLDEPIRQTNNYVVFDRFFPESSNLEQKSPNIKNNHLQTTPRGSTTPLYGRYGVPRPPCSMAQIIHNTTPQKYNDSASDTASIRLMEESICGTPKLERPKSLEIQVPVQEPEDSVDNQEEIDEEETIELPEIEKLEIIPKISPQIGVQHDQENEPKTSPHLTEKGYFDLKFYHNKLW